MVSHHWLCQLHGAGPWGPPAGCGLHVGQVEVEAVFPEADDVGCVCVCVCVCVWGFWAVTESVIHKHHQHGRPGVQYPCRNLKLT